MAVKKFTVELQCEFSDEEKYMVIRNALREAARTVFTTALMMQERRKPAIAMHSNDFFEGPQQFDVLVDEVPGQPTVKSDGEETG